MSAIAVPAKIQPPRMGPWRAYVITFLLVWAVLMFGFGLLPEVIRQWPMALVMTLGSLVAGSTPMGGGAVSFPFLVLWLHIPTEIARNFALCIQALGMTSAMIFILCRRVPIQKELLLWTISGAAAGMTAGTLWLAPLVAPNYVKLVFTCLWMSFAILTVARNREICALVGAREIGAAEMRRVGLIVGLIGGLIASMIGVGVEMALYTVLVLLYRCDLKIAVPTAVSAMAVSSVVGLALHLAMGDIPRDVAFKFLAAGPIVIFGAPIGTYIVSVIPRIRTLYVVSVLCALQFVWTLTQMQRTPAEWIFVASAIALAGGGFFMMYRRGKQATSNAV